MLPVLFTLPTPWGPQPVYAYGVLLGLAFIAGFVLVERRGKQREDAEQSTFGNAYLVAAVLGMIGARLLYVLENREQFADSGARWFDVTSGGLAAYGGVIGGALGAAAYLRWKRVPLGEFGDAVAPAVAIGTVLTRLGCYLYGCDFGRVLPEGAPEWLKALGRFPRWQFAEGKLNGSPAYLHHANVFGLPNDATTSLPVHPVQLYEAIGGLVLLGLALKVARRQSFSGQVILVVGMAYAVLRFMLEFLRDDPERAELFGFSSGQLFSLLLGAICALLYSASRSAARRAR